MKIKELLTKKPYTAEKLIRDSERLSIAKDYVKNNKYIDKTELLIILGENPQKEDAE